MAKGSHITSRTIDRLRQEWTYEAPGGGTFGNFPTNPLVIGDHVYVGDLTTRVHAVDLATGKEQYVVGDDASIFGPTGVGAGWGRLYGTKANAKGRGSVVVAYDATSGKELWATDIGAGGGDINVQPVAYDGLVYSSTSGYGAGTRATIYALDAETGAIVWHFSVVEDPDLWGHPELNSGGGVWYPPTIDAARGVAYFGTGNPYPFPGAKGYPNGSSRPGENRWTDSILALDLKTGKLRWGHQAIAHDIFDRDSMLTGRVDATIDGRTVPLAISTGKLGVVTALDARTGKVVWKTPVGTHQNDELTEIDGPTLVYPGSLGGVQTPMAVSNGTIYLCVMNAPTQYAGPEETSYGFSVKLGTADAQLVAISAATGKVRWSKDLPGDSFGGATVINDLVLTSSFGGELLAFDKATGKQVWSWKGPGGINGWPAVAGDRIIVPFGMADPPQLVSLELPS
ncbi:MAG: PQQ-binding-like beta-propeller repeat protein [Acidimicrobiales bacterium]